MSDSEIDSKFDPTAYDDYDMGGGYDNNDEDEIIIQVYINAGKAPFFLTDPKAPNKRKEFKGSDKVSVLKQFILDNVPLKEKNGYYKLEDLKILSSKGVMKKDDKLCEHADKAGATWTVNALIKSLVNGGSKVKQEYKDDEKIDPKKSKKKKIVKNVTKEVFFSFENPRRSKKRIIKIKKTNKKKFPFSKDACIVTFDKNPKNNVRMPCKHTISPIALFNIMLLTFINTKNEYDIHCPLPKCKKKWNFGFCCFAACLNQIEFLQFQTEREERKSPKKRCPHCKIFCERPLNLKYHRVACKCGKGDWCYECENKWNKNGFTVCGNTGCMTSHINDFLKNCNKEYNVSGKTVPELRACPSCYNLIQHTRACNHIQCKSCGNYFCFICLDIPKKKNDGSQIWKCFGGCKPASVQLVE